MRLPIYHRKRTLILKSKRYVIYQPFHQNKLAQSDVKSFLILRSIVLFFRPDLEFGSENIHQISSTNSNFPSYDISFMYKPEHLLDLDIGFWSPSRGAHPPRLGQRESSPRARPPRVGQRGWVRYPNFRYRLIHASVVFSIWSVLWTQHWRSNYSIDSLVNFRINISW